MPSVGSAGNLTAAALLNNPVAAAVQGAGGLPLGAAAAQRAGSAGLLPGVRPGGGGMFAGGVGRPLGGGMGGPAGSAASSLTSGSAAAAQQQHDPDAALKSKVAAAIKGMKAGEVPKVEPPEGHEWVQCLGKDGKPGWFAVVKAKAAALRAGTKRKAEEAAGGGGGGKKGKKAADDELVAGGGPVTMMLMDDDAVEAEEAAAKGAVVVEAGNVQVRFWLYGVLCL